MTNSQSVPPFGRGGKSKKRKKNKEKQKEIAKSRFLPPLLRFALGRAGAGSHGSRGTLGLVPSLVGDDGGQGAAGIMSHRAPGQ